MKICVYFVSYIRAVL